MIIVITNAINVIALLFLPYISSLFSFLYFIPIIFSFVFYFFLNYIFLYLVSQSFFYFWCLNIILIVLFVFIKYLSRYFHFFTTKLRLYQKNNVNKIFKIRIKKYFDNIIISAITIIASVNCSGYVDHISHFFCKKIIKGDCPLPPLVFFICNFYFLHYLIFLLFVQQILFLLFVLILRLLF